jgi:uncharacterized protein YeaO (DUF488 family)
MYKIKRVYLAPEKQDNFRVLVDRLWPRGFSKEKANIDLWLKDIAPSNDLRIWFGNDIEKYGSFKKKYLDELKDKKELIKQLRTMEKIHQTVTLVYSSKDEKHNNAVLLMEFLKKPPKKVLMGISRTHG